MVKIIEKLVPQSKYSIKCPYTMTPTGLSAIMPLFNEEDK